MNKFLGIWAAVLLLCGGLAAEGQDDLLHQAKIGIIAGTGLRLYTGPPSLLAEGTWAGVIFHIIPAIALRPSLVFYKLSEDVIDNVTPASSTTSENGGLGLALGAFYFSRPKRNFMLYLGPEVKFFFSSEMDFYDNGDKKSDTAVQQLSAAALIGTQYMFSDRFAFQADAGLGMLRYSEHDIDWTIAGTKTWDKETNETTFFIRPAYLVVVFYFN